MLLPKLNLHILKTIFFCKEHINAEAVSTLCESSLYRSEMGIIARILELSNVG